MKEYSEIFGREELKQHIHEIIRSGMISHAYLLIGAYGTGKRVIARRFARTLECETLGAKLDSGLAGINDIIPCDHCTPCIQEISGSNPDVIIIDCEEGKNSISVDEIRRRVVDDVVIKPYGRYKIYIIINAQNMTAEAQNAILKTLEEPPEYAIIMLLATTESLILPTVRSRCKIIDVPVASPEVVREYIQKHYGHIEGVTPDDIRFAEKFADGKIGRASLVFEDPEFNSLLKDVLHLVCNVGDMSFNEMLDCIKKVDTYRHLDINYFFDLMTLWYRDVLLFESTRDANGILFKNQITEIDRQAQLLSYDGVDKIMSALYKVRARLGANVNFELTMEMLFLTLKDLMQR